MRVKLSTVVKLEQVEAKEIGVNSEIFVVMPREGSDGTKYQGYIDIAVGLISKRIPFDRKDGVVLVDDAAQASLAADFTELLEALVTSAENKYGKEYDDGNAETGEEPYR